MEKVFIHLIADPLCECGSRYEIVTVANGQTEVGPMCLNLMEGVQRAYQIADKYKGREVQITFTPRNCISKIKTEQG